MAHYNFSQDLEDGEAGEHEVVTLFAQEYDGTPIASNDTNRYDRIINFPNGSVFGHGPVSFEIKTDVLITPTKDTGNLFIEVQSRGKKSGIQVCTADWFVYYLKHLNEIWSIRPTDLLALIRTGRFRDVYGGDEGSGTRGVLIPRASERSHFLVIPMRTL